MCSPCARNHSLKPNSFFIIQFFLLYVDKMVPLSPSRKGTVFIEILCCLCSFTLLGNTRIAYFSLFFVNFNLLLLPVVGLLWTNLKSHTYYIAEFIRESYIMRFAAGFRRICSFSYLVCYFVFYNRADYLSKPVRWWKINWNESSRTYIRTSKWMNTKRRNK